MKEQNEKFHFQRYLKTPITWTEITWRFHSNIISKMNEN